jgi:cysteinyl-tRNA synthetase
MGQDKRLEEIVALLLVLALAACTSNAHTPAPPFPHTPIPTPDWLAVNDFLYQLQRARPDRIGETAYDLAVLQIGAAGGSPEVIENLKHSLGGEKIILCYMSIGQAEDYRFYWQREWRENPPAWLDEPDPDWAGDYWVRYWNPEWQAIIYGSPDSYLDRILDLGFDGVYLDRVDTYEYHYEKEGRETAAREMADFVIGLAKYARERHPGFGVFPQNAEELGTRFPDYLETVTGVGVEDLYYGYPRDHEPSPADWTAEREAILDQWVAAGKLVLTIDYTRIPEQIDDAYARAQARGYVPFVTVRSLGQLIINEGHEPD